MAKIVIVGSANADLVARVERFPAPGETLAGAEFRVIPGGKGANQAVAAGRLSSDVTFVGCMGNDANGDLLLASLGAAGVDCKVRRDSEPSGVAMILVDAVGQNEIVVISGANGKLAPEHLESSVPDADVVLFQLETPIETVAAGLRMARGLTILNPAPARQLPDDFPWSRIGVLTPNETETEALCGIRPVYEETCGSAAHALMSRGVSTVVITLGERGCYLQSPEASGLVPSFPITPVDTTAAGDAFNGGLAVFLAEGKSLAEALRWANAVGALSATKPGAQPSMPSRGEVEALLVG